MTYQLHQRLSPRRIPAHIARARSTHSTTGTFSRASTAEPAIVRPDLEEASRYCACGGLTATPNQTWTLIMELLVFSGLGYRIWWAGGGKWLSYEFRKGVRGRSLLRRILSPREDRDDKGQRRSHSMPREPRRLGQPRWIRWSRMWPWCWF